MTRPLEYDSAKWLRTQRIPCSPILKERYTGRPRNDNGAPRNILALPPRPAARRPAPLANFTQNNMSAIEITVGMRIDVDGSPNAYGPDDDQALDFELNAHVGAKKEKPIVGYLTAADKRTPIVQDKSLGDPCPGFFISTTAYFDKNNARESDPRRYVNAAEINYTLWARKARDGGVKLGDFCVVHSKRTRRTVYTIVGDSGNDSGAEGSLALLQRLGYPFKNGKSGEAKEEIVVRYFPGSNPNRLFFFNQSDLEDAARGLDL